MKVKFQSSFIGIGLALLGSPLLLSSTAQAAKLQTSAPPEWQSFYSQRYDLTDEFEKLVDDDGDGFDALYGTRNFREVLPGIVYRGGANNVHDRYGTRSDENPLPTLGVVNLCKEGFATAVYLYPTNYSDAPSSEDCTSVRGGQNHLDYLQITAFDLTQIHALLQIVADHINGVKSGPIYMHCWNGWHASGFASALVLRQFCGFTAEQAINYWNENTDGNDTGAIYDQIRNQIAAFVPDSSLAIAPELQSKVCPVAK